MIVSIILKAGFAISLFVSSLSCSVSAREKDKIIIEGSTPGDSLVTSMLGIPQSKEAEFIRWKLELSETMNKKGTFTLNINYGKAKQNTNGFINGGEKILLTGDYNISQGKGYLINFPLYVLKSDSTHTEISLVMLNDDIYHLLTPDFKLMKGNEGWSYGLYRTSSTNLPRENIEGEKAQLLPAFSNISETMTIHSVQTIFQGRTPCKPIAQEQKFPVTADCFKLKWQIILNRNSETLEPSSFELRWIFREVHDLKGKWKIIQGNPSNPRAVIYQLDPDNGGNPFYFLAADENLLLFIDKDFRLRKGNADFGYSLNRKTEKD